jgi:uncharacterized protein
VKVDCDIRKWDGRSHYRFDVELLGRDEHGTWLAGRPPVPFAGPEYPGVFDYRFAILVPEDRWWIATFYAPDPRLEIETYVDIATPTRWISESHLTAVDLDLDVVRRFDGTLYIDDEDEFDDHRVSYGYPSDVVETARRTASELLDALTQSREPFRDIGHRWLDKV